MKLRATVRQDAAGRLTQLHVKKGKQTRGLKLDFEYGHDGFVRDIFFEGKRKDMPDLTAIVDLLTESFIERIGTIQTIGEIKDFASGTTERFYKAKDLGAAEWWEDALVLENAGTLLYLVFYIPAGAGNEGSLLKIECDDNTVFYWSAESLDSYGYCATSDGMQVLKYAVDGVCIVHVTVPFKWRSNFTVTIRSITGGVYKIEGASNVVES